MSIRSAMLLIAAAATAGAAAPTAASAHALLAAPPAYAHSGACYAHVRRAPRYAPPPGPRGAWRLTPPRPGEPGPTWCFVTEPGGPPVLLDAGVDGWIRVACTHPVAHRPRPRPRPVRRPHRHACGCRPTPHRRPHLRHVVLRPAPCCTAPPPRPCCLRPTTPPPPPVVLIQPYNPAAHYGEGPRVLTWGGKRG